MIQLTIFIFAFCLAMVVGEGLMEIYRKYKSKNK